MRWRRCRVLRDFESRRVRFTVRQLVVAPTKTARRPHEIRTFCGEEEDRTPDLRIANAALSQLSYPPKAGHNISYGAFGNSLIVNDYFRRRTKLVFMRLF